MTTTNLELHMVIRIAVTKRPDFSLDRALVLWQRLSVELTPIIGDGGFDSLYARSLNLASAGFPWIVTKGIAQTKQSSFVDFMQMLKSREPDEAAQALVTLLTVFTDVLATLIGTSLTTRILRSAWGDDAFDLPVSEQNNE
jgi:hypothetical protein